MKKAYKKPALRVLGHLPEDAQLKKFQKICDDIAACMAAEAAAQDQAQLDRLAQMRRLCTDMIAERATWIAAQTEASIVAAASAVRWPVGAEAL